MSDLSDSSDPRHEALAAEHAAVWTYGVLRSRTSASAHPALARLLQRNYAAHRAARDALLAGLAADDQKPAVAAPSYPLPARLTSTKELTAAAAQIEASGTEVYAWVVSQSAGAIRKAAIESLERGAVRELGLRGIPETFPGATELANRTGLDTGP